GVERRILSCLGLEQIPNWKRAVARMVFDHLPRLIGGAVVDDEQLDLPRPAHRLQARQRISKIAGAVGSADDDRDVHGRGRLLRAVSSARSAPAGQLQWPAKQVQRWLL